MRDFCNAADRDSIRLIVAQDLKESGIDIDSSNLANLTSTFNMSSHNQSLFQQKTSNQQQVLGSNNNILNTSNNLLFQSKMSTQQGNKQSNNDLKQSENDSHLGPNSSSGGAGRIFGLNLKQLELVNINVNEQLLSVPVFLKHAFEYITDYVHVEGIFRRNGTASRLKELKKQVEEGTFNFSQFAIFDLTSLVKLFFREMPESLLTFSLYTNFIQAVKLDTTKSKLDSILNLCLQLPDSNLHVLIYLMSFLKKITQHESLNKMNSFNLAVCFAPNIIYTRINKVNDLYINEERIVVQLLIENSVMIGKISDSVYERSMMLNSLYCSNVLTTSHHHHHLHGVNLNNHGNDQSTSVTSSSSTSRIDSLHNMQNAAMNSNMTTSNANDMVFLYDNDENSSFALHAHSAGSTSLSSYSTSKKEKKKRRSSSLKELMNTIQNSISKFRRRSASEKNDKTTCSVITCTSMTAGPTDTASFNTSRFFDSTSTNEKHRILDTLSVTPFIASSSSKHNQLNTPILHANLYATPRINKRNAEESLQSTTKKKLMEKLPQRNLLLPNAPLTPFSTSKKSTKHPLKQLLSTSESSNIVSLPPQQSQNVTVVGGTSDILTNKPPLCTHLTTPSQKQQQQQHIQTPSTLTHSNTQAQASNTNNNMGNSSLAANPTNKQLRYDESPSLANKTCDIGSLKSKSYQHSIEKNLSLASAELMKHYSPSSSTSSCSSKHHRHSHRHGGGSSSSGSHHHHHHHHHHSSSHGHHHHHHHYSHGHHYHSSSSASAGSGHHHHHHHSTSGNSSTSSSSHHHLHQPHYHHSSSKQHSKQHQYVNAIPKSSRSNRYIDQTDLCTQIITGNLTANNFSASPSSSESNASNTCEYLSESVNNLASNCNNTNSNLNEHQRSLLADNSMRCTLRRGRPNTPKTGLSVEYRIRKSSVPNTPECTKHAASKINYTISNSDDIKLDDLKTDAIRPFKAKANTLVSSVSAASLNTAMVQLDDEDKKTDDLNDALILDDLQDDDANEVNHVNQECSKGSGSSSSSGSSSGSSSSSSSTCSLNKFTDSAKKRLSLSYSDLPKETHEDEQREQEKAQNEMKKSVSDDVLYKMSTDECNKQESEQDDKCADELICEEENKCDDLNEKIEMNNEDNDDDDDEEEGEDEESEKVNIDQVEEEMPKNAANRIIEEQAKLIKFEPLVATDKNSNNPPNFELFLQPSLSDMDDNMLQNVLKRQSLFKLKDKINGKVSKQISEIEKRKLSPYRFSNSPFKLKKFKEAGSSSLSIAGHISKHISPVRVPSIFCKKLLAETPKDSYVVKKSREHSKLSRTIATSNIAEVLKVAEHADGDDSNRKESDCLSNSINEFIKKSNKNRLNVTYNHGFSGLSAIDEVSVNDSSLKHTADLTDSDDKKNTTQTQSTRANNSSILQQSATNSPTSKQLLGEWSCSSEAIDL